MSSRFPYRFAVAFAAALVATFASAALAAPIPTKVDLAALRAIQVNNIQQGGDDDVYVLVSGVAKGQEVNKRIPPSGTLKANPKKPAITDKQPQTLWQGELNDGEFAFVTVVVMQGTGQDSAKIKAFQDQLGAAAKKAGDLSKKTLDAGGITGLHKQILAAQRPIITKIKDTFARAKNTDHYGGLFNVSVINNGGRLTKRVEPVGLTFGEHYGTDPKIYTKLKYTRNNVFEQEDNEWFETQYGPVNDDGDAIRVKMLETEYVKTGEQLIRKVTDYLADIKVYDLSGGGAGKALKWETGGEHTGPGTLHTYWDYAE
jgi:hypothetical protein